MIIAMTKRGINLAMTGIFDDFTHPLNPPPQGSGNLWIATKKLHFFAMMDFLDSR